MKSETSRSIGNTGSDKKEDISGIGYSPVFLGRGTHELQRVGNIPALKWDAGLVDMIWVLCVTT